MNAKELAELDLAVARAEGVIIRGINEPTEYLLPDTRGRIYFGKYQPTREGAEAMRLLEKYRLILVPRDDGRWNCDWSFKGPEVGETPAIAICRAVVALSGAERRANTPDATAGSETTTTKGHS